MKRISARLGALACLAGWTLSTPASAELIYGIAAVGNATALVTFDSATPNNLISSQFIRNLGTNETIVGIDFRPLNSRLYALGSSSRLYEVDTSTGIAASVNFNPFMPLLNGFSFGFDFNPTIDRIRAVAETNKNLVLQPDSGAVQLAATDLFYPGGDPNAGVDPNVVHSAYTNNFPGAQATQLYGIDTGLDILVTQANNAGTLGTVGPLGPNVGSLGGFDISGRTGTAYASFVQAGNSVSELYTINLATGNATLVGEVDGGIILTALSAAPIPEPSTMTLAASCLVTGTFLRRRAC